MRKLRWPGLVLLVLSALWPSARAAAAARRTDKAAVLLELGHAAYARGSYGPALRAFEGAYALRSHYRTLFHIGEAADRLGDRGRAVSAFQRYLALSPVASDRAYVNRRIAANLGVAPVSPRAAAPRNPDGAHDQARVPAAALATDTEQGRRDSGGAGPWWIWVGAGALVVIGVTVAAVALGSPASTTPDVVQGNLGRAVQTLAAP